VAPVNTQLGPASSGGAFFVAVEGALLSSQSKREQCSTDEKENPAGAPDHVRTDNAQESAKQNQRMATLETNSSLSIYRLRSCAPPTSPAKPCRSVAAH
jgi:hypothetical protein